MKGFSYRFPLIVFLLFAVAFAQAASLSQLTRLVKQKQYQQAYRLATDMNEKHVGDPAFDFLYGLAALYAKHPEQAAFAFERVLIIKPDNLRARLELGLAYYLMKNYTMSKKEFLTVLKANPPERVRNNIMKFLQMITQAEAAKQTNAVRRLYLRVGVNTGYDTNINTATSSDSIVIPVLGSITLNQNSREVGSYFLQTFVSPGFVVPLSERMTLYANAMANIRRNSRLSIYDTDTTAFAGGLVYSLDKQNQIIFPFMYNRLYLENNKANFRNMVSVAAKFYHFSSAASRYGLFYEVNNMVYPTAGASNTITNIFGASYKHVFAKYRLQWFNRLYMGKDTGRNATQNARWIMGLEERLDYYSKDSKYNPYFRVEVQNSPYDTNHVLLGRKRHDGLLDVSTGVRLQLPLGWLMDTQYRFTYNDSNGDLFTYRRHMVNVGLEYTFG